MTPWLSPEGKGIVLKLISDKAIHKSKEGLVKLDLRGKGEITAAFNYLVKKGEKLKPYKILAQKMSGGGIEIIMGGSTDKQFGRMLLVGLGGVYVETFKDVELRLCPISKDDAKEMLADLRSGGVITYNGRGHGDARLAPDQGLQAARRERGRQRAGPESGDSQGGFLRCSGHQDNQVMACREE